MVVKLYYRNPNDPQMDYGKEIVCKTSIKYNANLIRFNLEFAYETHQIADNNNIPFDLIYKAELIDDSGNIIFDRKGLPLHVKFQSYVIDMVFPKDLKDMEYYHKDEDVFLLYWKGNVYVNKTEEEWDNLLTSEKSDIKNKIRYTQKTKCYDIELQDQNIYFFSSELFNS